MSLSPQRNRHFFFSYVAVSASKDMMMNRNKLIKIIKKALRFGQTPPVNPTCCVYSYLRFPSYSHSHTNIPLKIFPWSYYSHIIPMIFLSYSHETSHKTSHKTTHHSIGTRHSDDISTVCPWYFHIIMIFPSFLRDNIHKTCHNTSHNTSHKASH